MDRIIILCSKTNVMSNDASNESEKILESLFEPDNAEILLELKNGPKSLSILTEKITISEEDLNKKFRCLFHFCLQIPSLLKMKVFRRDRKSVV